MGRQEDIKLIRNVEKKILTLTENGPVLLSLIASHSDPKQRQNLPRMYQELKKHRKRFSFEIIFKHNRDVTYVNCTDRKRTIQLLELPLEVVSNIYFKIKESSPANKENLTKTKLTKTQKQNVANKKSPLPMNVKRNKMSSNLFDNLTPLPTSPITEIHTTSNLIPNNQQCKNKHSNSFNRFIERDLNNLNFQQENTLPDDENLLKQQVQFAEELLDQYSIINSRLQQTIETQTAHLSWIQNLTSPNY